MMSVLEALLEQDRAERCVASWLSKVDSLTCCCVWWVVEGGRSVETLIALPNCLLLNEMTPPPRLWVIFRDKWAVRSGEMAQRMRNRLHYCHTTKDGGNMCAVAPRMGLSCCGGVRT